MSESSDDEGSLELVNSQERRPIYTVTPRSILFVFKFKDVKGKTYQHFKYILNEGKILPHDTVIKGNFNYLPSIFIYISKIFSYFLHVDLNL